MRLHNTTAVPNVFFDQQLASLSGSAVRVYLKIIRNVLGWRDGSGRVKDRDWIAHSQFEKTGLSNRSVTSAIDELLSKGMIAVSDALGNDISDPATRKKAKRVFYALVLPDQAKTTGYHEKTKEKLPQELRTTKEILLPKYTADTRLSDQERYQELLAQEAQKQAQRDHWRR